VAGVTGVAPTLHHPRASREGHPHLWGDRRDGTLAARVPQRCSVPAHPVGLPSGERLVFVYDRVGYGGAPAGDAASATGPVTEHGPSGPRSVSRGSGRTSQAATALPGGCTASPQAARLDPIRGRFGNTPYCCCVLLSHCVEPGGRPLSEVSQGVSSIDHSCQRVVPRPHIDSSQNSNVAPFSTGAVKNSVGRQLRRSTQKKIKKTAICAGQIRWPGAGSNRRPSDSESNPLVCAGHYSTVPPSCSFAERDRLSALNICHHEPPQCGGKVGFRS
jgi:hypothetical protein